MSTIHKIITIDGPAGAGKSTVAHQLAQRLGMEYLDTGGMYRAAALLGILHQVDWDVPDQLVRLVREHRIEGCHGKTFLDGKDVSKQIRSPQVTQFTQFSANNPDIRSIMVEIQRKTAKSRDLITEGRDQGSVVFPDALCKFYLTASPEERAKRRFEQQNHHHPSETFENVLKKINRRDDQDRNRQSGPLVVPEDAILIDSDGRSVEEVVSAMEKEVRRLIEKLPE